MKDLTPERFRCVISVSCPAVLELTPEQFRCGPIASSCPAVLEADNKLIVIGKAVTEQDYPELAGRIGPDEQAIEISAELVREALK